MRHFFSRLRKRHLGMLLCALLVLGGALLIPELVSAQNEFGTEQFEQTTVLGGGDIRVTIVRIIRAILSFLGVLTLGLMLYGGFIWMTSGGSEEKIAQARRIMTNAAVGLAIILSSVAIVQFFLSRFQAAANPAQEEDPIEECEDAAECQDLVIGERRCADRGFVVTSITPNTPKADPTGMSNILVRAIFSKPLKANQDISEVLSVVKDGDEDEALEVFASKFIANRYGVEFQLEGNTDVCEANGEVKGCLPAGEYDVIINPELKSSGGQELKDELNCNGEDIAFPREAEFWVNRDLIDEDAPVAAPANDPISVIPPEGVEIGRGANQNFMLERGQEYQIQVTMNDRRDVGGINTGGIAYASYEFKQVAPAKPGTVTFTDGPRIEDGSNNPYTFEIPFNLGANVPKWSVHEVKITMHDIDHNVSEVETSIVVVGEGCIADPEAEGCEPPPECADDRQCPSQKCLENQCVAWPMITNVNEWSGGAGNLLTISGFNFGDDPGQIALGHDANGNGEYEDGEWLDANVAQCGGNDVWHDRWVVVEVPPDNQNHPVFSSSSVRLIKKAGDDDPIPFLDNTTDDHGPIPGPYEGLFVRNKEFRPGLCFVETRDGGGPNGDRAAGLRDGYPGDPIRAVGQGFGNGENSALLVGGQQAAVDGRWEDGEIFAIVPAGMASGTVGVAVNNRGIQGNGVPFTVRGLEQPALPPVIDAISPSSTTRESYITITGSGFGNIIGKVWTAKTYEGVLTCPNIVGRDETCKKMETQLPAFCGDTWSDSQIIVEVPDDALAPATHFVLVETSNRLTTEGEVRFEVEAGPARPSICSLDPIEGPAPLVAGTRLRIRGTNFRTNVRGIGTLAYFWKATSDITDLRTWLPARRVNNEDSLGIHNISDIEIMTDIPVARGGITMPPGSGPIAIAHRGGVSNFVQYTVGSCLDAERDENGNRIPPRPGYHCCTEGPDEGAWKSAANACAGEVREAGYVWRFSTGRVPRAPQVVEFCAPGEEGALPSPTPWENWRDGANACINSVVTVRFTQAMDTNTFDGNVAVWDCGEGDAPDCGREPVVITDNYEVDPIGNDAFQLNFKDESHLPNKWHRVVLTNSIQGVSLIQGLDVPENVPLIQTKSLDGYPEVSYYFDFKTNEDRCRLTSVAIHPDTHTATQLGIILDPRYGFNPLHRQYFNLFGRGNQACSVIDAGSGWEWDSTNDAVAEETIDPPANKPNYDRRVHVTALQDDGGRPVEITAASSSIGFTATTTISVTLAEPEVTAFWPNCGVACPNASIGVQFSREMFLRDLGQEGVLTLEECRDETCAETNIVPLMPIEAQNPFLYEQFLPEGEVFESNTWYKVTVSEELRAVAQIDPDKQLGAGRQVRAGRPLAPLHEDGSYAWKFRTKADDEFCILDDTVIEPSEHLATQVGEITAYSVVPISSPDECSVRGQRLNPWGYGWEWSTTHDNQEKKVAEVTNMRTSFALSPYCTNACLPTGSNIARGNDLYLCGNGIVEPGEDCEIVENGQIIDGLGTACTLECLRPGNPDAGGPEDGAGFCGNGIVEPAVGEECDEESAFCTDNCTFAGSSQEKPDDDALPWCGSGLKTLGEDCDIALEVDVARQAFGMEAPDGRVGCSSSCLHEGTRLSQNFCATYGDVPFGNTTIEELPACKSALTACGNSIIEAGEQCEVMYMLDEDGNEIVDPNHLIYRTAEGQDMMNVADVADHCTPRCTLQNICELDQIPTKQNPGDSGLRCLQGDGCRADCTLAGSSALYEPASICGDGEVGFGEDFSCELPNAIIAEDTLGENPVQLVTAIGEGEVNPETGTQVTEIMSKPLRVRERDQNVREFDEIFQQEHTAVGDYQLQCGYTEQTAGGRDVLTNHDGDMEDERMGVPGQLGLWVPWRIKDGDVARKVTEPDLVYRGNSSLYVNLDGRGIRGLRQLNIPVEPGIYEFGAQYKLTKGSFRFYLTKGQGGSIRSVTVNELSEDWQQMRERVRVPEGTEEVTIYLMGTGAADITIDDVRLVRINRAAPILTNDCPVNDRNTQGVGSNSCCYDRPTRTENYPLDGAGLPGAPQDRIAGVCRNTLISVGFAADINKNSLSENIILARGYEDPNHICAGQGETDVTADVQAQLADARYEQDRGFWGNIWEGIQGFFAGIFKMEARALVVEPEDIAVWCAGTVGADPIMQKIKGEAGVVSTSTVSLYLSDSLDEDSVYAVMLHGGTDGIKDEQGVGLMAPEPASNNIHALDDLFVFKTSGQICELEDVIVTPDTHFFTRPNTTEERAPEFLIDTVSTNGQRIVPTPAYAWRWDWIPTTTPLYRIPVEPREGIAIGDQTDTPLMKIGATELEGTLAVAGQAKVDNGDVFSAITTLTSDFCENPWPLRETYPYEDGVPFGRDTNNDRYMPGMGFSGGEMDRTAGEYFNYSFGYCADAGRTGNTRDDLPILRPVITHGGVCQFSRNACNENADCLNAFQSDDVVRLVSDGAQYYCGVREEGRVAAFGRTDKPIDIKLGGEDYEITHFVGCSANADCQNAERYKNVAGNYAFRMLGRAQPANRAEQEALISEAICLGADAPPVDALQKEQCVVPFGEQTLDDAIKQTLFFNDKNEDVVGIKIFTNGDRLSARDWYESRPYRAEVVRDLIIDGYDAVTDGNSYFINFLNMEDNGQIRNYIYALSINEDAQANTRQVFDQLLDSLVFNINMSDIGYCLAPGLRVEDLLSRQDNRQVQISGVPCVSDFDCREDNGDAKGGTNGICSVERTKFTNDWQRLEELRFAQANLERYRSNAGEYPQMGGGSYIPRYTNSRWPSWGQLGRTINGITTDPLNRWSDCSAEDGQTCWSEAQTEFICPAYSSVYEYAVNLETKRYQLHVPFEYFRESDDIVREFVDVTGITTDPWCAGERVNPFVDQCGDGVINPNTEQCDPPGETMLSTDGCPAGQARQNTCSAQCQIDVADCKPVAVCGDGRTDFDLGEVCDSGALNGTYGQCAGECSFFNDENGNGVADRELGECIAERACQELHPAQCGNGVVDGEEEFCDIGEARYQDQESPLYSVNEGDSCAWDCQSVGGYCGDGVTQAEFGETCDDGNRDDLDGCSASCLQENLACRQNARIEQLLDAVGENIVQTIVELRYDDGAPVQSCFGGSTPADICRAYGLGCVGWAEQDWQGGAPNTCDEPMGDDEINDGEVNFVICAGGNAADLGVAEENIPASCGNGIQEVGEDCDLGVQNGRGCEPGYNQTCVACSADCRTDITVQPTAYCGNEIIEEGFGESCETLPDGRIVAQDDAYGALDGCPAGQVGSLSCNNQCQLQPVEETCVLCGLVENNRGALPELAIVNPMGPIDFAANRDWKNALNLGFYRINRNNGFYQRVANRPVNAIPQTFRYFPVFADYNGFENDRLITNRLCAQEYAVLANVPHLGAEYGLQGWQEGRLGQEVLMRSKTGVLPYVVDGEGRTVQNELVVSPAVPEGAFRVVVRWTKEEDDRGVSFPGYVYYATDEHEIGEDDIVSLMKAQEPGGISVSREYSFGGDDLSPNDEPSWFPNGVWDAGQSVAVHGPMHVENTWTQAFTLYPDERGEGHPYSFFVGVASRNAQVPMPLFQNSNVTVEVYTYQEGQNNEFSIYPPTYVFELDQAKASGNVDAQYWHVFNLVERGAGRGYQVELIREYVDADGDGVQEPGPALGHGAVATDWDEVLLNLESSIAGQPATPEAESIYFWWRELGNFRPRFDVEGLGDQAPQLPFGF